jgi:catechol 2,3-dioxygenase-like lactoylglutathione lyase family enzyme
MPRLHHVNLCVPPTVRDDAGSERAGTDAERAWLELLGYRRIEAGPEISAMAQVHWFEADDGTQVHLTPDAAHAPSKVAHTAIRLDDELDATVARLEAAGHTCNTIAFDGDRHVFAHDPAGNLWELIGPLAS